MPKHRFTITFECQMKEEYYPPDLDAEGRLALDLENFSDDFNSLEHVLRMSDFVITGEVIE